MARIKWGDSGKRFFEAGADRGVLYVEDNDGVPWNGLISVKESPSGGDPQPYYIDGYKYINLAAAEEFEATLEAFSSPHEFGVCDGTFDLGYGLFITQQRRQQFNLAYRTGLGNDVDGLELGYKLHLIYNALAQPSSRNNQTLNDNPEPNTLSWDITTAPPRMMGYAPTAHMVVDSTKTPPEMLSNLENILYGTDINPPKLPSQIEMLAFFGAYVPFTVTDLGAGEYSAQGTAVAIATPATFTIFHESVTNNGDGSFTIDY